MMEQGLSYGVRFDDFEVFRTRGSIWHHLIRETFMQILFYSNIKTRELFYEFLQCSESCHVLEKTLTCAKRYRNHDIPDLHVSPGHLQSPSWIYHRDPWAIIPCRLRLGLQNLETYV